MFYKSRGKNEAAFPVYRHLQKLHAAHSIVCIITLYVIAMRALLWLKQPLGERVFYDCSSSEQQRTDRWCSRIKAWALRAGVEATSYGVRYGVAKDEKLSHVQVEERRKRAGHSARSRQYMRYEGHDTLADPYHAGIYAQQMRTYHAMGGATDTEEQSMVSVCTCSVQGECHARSRGHDQHMQAD